MFVMCCGSGLPLSSSLLPSFIFSILLESGLGPACKRLSVVVADDKAGGLFLDEPRRRKRRAASLTGRPHSVMPFWLVAALIVSGSGVGRRVLTPRQAKSVLAAVRTRAFHLSGVRAPT